MFVQWVRNPQPADECEYRSIIIGNFGQLTLKVVDIGLKVIAPPYFDGEKVIFVLDIPARGVLHEEHIDYLKIVERM